MLILEDDIRFAHHDHHGTSRFVTACHKALQLLPDDAGILYLGISARGERTYLDDGRDPGAAHDPMNPNIRLYRPSYGYHTHAYAITKEASQILLDQLPIKGPIDVWLADNHWFDIPVYCAVIAGEGWELEDGSLEGRNLIEQCRGGMKNDIVHSCR